MKYTNAEIRGAILRAADRIHRKPSLYNFMRGSIPRSDKQSGCMLGWIGYELGLEGTISATSDVLNISHTEFYEFCGATPAGLRFWRKWFWLERAKAAAFCMRALANEFYPAASA